MYKFNPFTGTFDLTSLSTPSITLNNSIPRFSGETGSALNSTSVLISNENNLSIYSGEFGDSSTESMLFMQQIWNTSISPTAFKININYTQSNNEANFLDFQLNSDSIFRVRKNADILTNQSSLLLSTGKFLAPSGSPVEVQDYLKIGSYGVELKTRDQNILEQVKGTSAQSSAFYSTFTSSTAYQRMFLTCAKRTISNPAGTSVITGGNFIPAGAFLMGVSSRVNSNIVMSTGSTGFSLGTVEDPDLWGTYSTLLVEENNVVSSGTASKASAIVGESTGYTSSNACGLFINPQEITLTANDGTFSGTGSIEISIFYFMSEAD